jgi:hypothetical protein
MRQTPRKPIEEMSWYGVEVVVEVPAYTVEAVVSWKSNAEGSFVAAVPVAACDYLGALATRYSKTLFPWTLRCHTKKEDAPVNMLKHDGCDERLRWSPW